MTGIEKSRELNMKMVKNLYLGFALSLGLLSLLLSSAQASEGSGYGYPLENRYAATIIGTPAPFKAELPARTRARQLKVKVIENRRLPDLFWYSDGLSFSLVYQKKEAPLIFVIAGTGASYKSPKMVALQKAFYQAGFHVISITSPTHPDFILSASATGIPGHIEEDSLDLYRVMQLAWMQVRSKIEVTEFHLTGYSLGGAQAAFISQIDERERYFDFKKVLMVNPPVSLYSSALLLDEMLEENIPGGLDRIDLFFDRAMDRFSAVYKKREFVDFNDEFLYEAYRQHQPSDEDMKALIGISFRHSAANMIFTSDVLTVSGYIVPKNRKLTATDSLTDYFKVSVQVGFRDYFEEYFYPYFKSKQPDLSEKALLRRLSLESIEGYLKKTEKIGLVTNEDDPILLREDLAYFRRALGARARIYPSGGHCGNLDYKENVAYMVDFFNDGQAL